jgi:hypothetical protein
LQGLGAVVNVRGIFTPRSLKHSTHSGPKTKLAPPFSGRYQDISKLITALSRGVKGSGVYRNVSYRVAGAKKIRCRLPQLLEWQNGQLKMVLKDAPVVEIENDDQAMAAKDDE